MPLERKV